MFLETNLLAFPNPHNTEEESTHLCHDPINHTYIYKRGHLVIISYKEG